MDRQDFTRDWYHRQNFQNQEAVEMRDIERRRSGNRFYPPSDFGDYRRHDVEEPPADYVTTDKRYVPIPGIARTRNSFAGVGVSPRNTSLYTNGQFQTQNVQPYTNAGFVQEGPKRQSSSAYPNGYQRPENSGPRSDSRNSAYIMYDGKGYTSSEAGQHYAVPREVSNVRPSWVDKASVTNDADEEKRKKPNLTKLIPRIFAVIFIIWDQVQDWLLSLASGDFDFNKHKNDIECSANKNVSEVFGYSSSSTYVTDVCRHPDVVWKVYTAFSLIGTLISIIQIINIGCEMIKTCKPNVFQVLHGQSEVLLALFFEELPQVCLTVSVTFLCACSDHENNTDVRIFALLSIVSAAVSTTMRYATSFSGLSENGGCCNTWWRCACCRNKDYFCKIHPKELFCICDIPCPLCCCTLHCKMCKWSPQTWCAPLLKAFSCFCNCCSTDQEMYGIRTVNNFGILLLWFCVSFEIAIFVITGTDYYGV